MIGNNEEIFRKDVENVRSILLKNFDQKLMNKDFSRENLLKECEKEVSIVIKENFPEAGDETLNFISKNILKEIEGKEKYTVKAIEEAIRDRIRNKNIILNAKTKRDDKWRAYSPLDKTDSHPEVLMLLRNSEARLNTIVDLFMCYKEHSDAMGEVLTSGMEVIIISSVEMILSAFELLRSCEGVKVDVLSRRRQILNSWPMILAVDAYNIRLKEQDGNEKTKTYTEKEYKEDLKILDTVIDIGVPTDSKELEKVLIQITRLRDAWYAIATHQLLLIKNNKKGKKHMYTKEQLEAFDTIVVQAAEEALELLVRDYNNRIDDAVSEIEKLKKTYGEDGIECEEALKKEIGEVQEEYWEVFEDNDQIKKKITGTLDSLGKQALAWEMMEDLISREDEEQFRNEFYKELLSLLEENEHTKNLADYDELLVTGEHYIDELIGDDRSGSYNRAYNKLI